MSSIVGFFLLQQLSLILVAPSFGQEVLYLLYRQNFTDVFDTAVNGMSEMAITLNFLILLMFVIFSS